MAAKKWPVLEPYVMYSVGELSNVTDLSNWGNLNVQFIGKLMNEEGVYICQELQKNSTKSICTDLSLVDQIPARNSTVRVWGEIAVQERANRFIPAIRAKIVRALDSVDIPLHRRSLDIHHIYTPHFAVTRPKTSLSESLCKKPR